MVNLTVSLMHCKIPLVDSNVTIMIFWTSLMFLCKFLKKVYKEHRCTKLQVAVNGSQTHSTTPINYEGQQWV